MVVRNSYKSKDRRRYGEQDKKKDNKVTNKETADTFLFRRVSYVTPFVMD